MMTSFALPERKAFSDDLKPRVTLPDFMARARQELIVSAVFLVLRGGILVDVGRRDLSAKRKILCYRRTGNLVINEEVICLRLEERNLLCKRNLL
jgi:hypothetical protein